TSNPSTPSRSSEATSERLRSQLVSVGERSIGFDKVIGEEAARRRSSGEYRITELAETVSRQNKALPDEVGREDRAAGGRWCMANDVLDKLQNSVIGKLEQVTKLVEDLALCETQGLRGMGAVSDEPLRWDVLYYIYEQTSNAHQHSEERTAAVMQGARVVAESDLACKSVLPVGMQGLCVALRLLVEPGETKSSARFIQQRFQQDGNSIQTQLMQLTDHNEPQLFRASPVEPVVEH
ncbi:hypothetical protein FOZ63_027256, partial [Perkinsus olseni]